ncbi:MAG: DUF2510 domain-containing protein [Ilumatobacteraceae bacterium]
MRALMAADDGTGVAAVLIVVWLIVLAAMIPLFILWIVRLIEVIKLPEAQYQNAGTEKLTWILVVALAGWIGALVWQFGSTRKRVLDASPVVAWGAMPVQAYGGTPPGWFPDPQNPAMLRWWDGRVWTEHRQPPPPR